MFHVVFPPYVGPSVDLQHDRIQSAARFAEKGVGDHRAMIREIHLYREAFLHKKALDSLYQPRRRIAGFCSKADIGTGSRIYPE